MRVSTLLYIFTHYAIYTTTSSVAYHSQTHTNHRHSTRFSSFLTVNWTKRKYSNMIYEYFRKKRRETGKMKKKIKKLLLTYLLLRIFVRNNNGNVCIEKTNRRSSHVKQMNSKIINKKIAKHFIYVGCCFCSCSSAVQVFLLCFFLYLFLFARLRMLICYSIMYIICYSSHIDNSDNNSCELSLYLFLFSFLWTKRRKRTKTKRQQQQQQPHKLLRFILFSYSVCDVAP